MEQQNRENNDEINLYDFWKVIVKRKKLIIGLFIVIVVSTAIGSFLMPNIYRGEAVLDILVLKSEITAKEIIDLIGNVDGEKRLSIAPKSYPNIKDIKFKDIKDSKDKIVVSIDAKRIDDIPKALTEILNYLNNINIFKSAVEQEKAALLKKSAELSEIVKLAPDLLATYDKQIKAGKISMIGFDPIILHKNIIEIRMELFTVEQQLSKLNNGLIIIADQPHISNNRVSPKILRNVVAAGILSLLLGVFLAAFIGYIGNIKNKNSKPVNNSSIE